jgi:hypothetical protein
MKKEGPPSDCRAYQERLQQQLDGQPVGWPAALVEHLRDCPACAALQGAARRLTAGLQKLTPPTPPPDLAGQITARVLADDRSQKTAGRIQRLRWAVAALVAAAVLLALGLRFRATPTTPPAPEVPDLAAAATPRPLRDSMEEARTAVAALTNRTADAAVGETAFLLPPVPEPMLPESAAESLEPSLRPFREAGAEVSSGLEPVTDSARRALQLFLRDQPSEEGAKPPASKLN